MGNNNRKIAVMLAGSGVYDGTEINEAVLTLLSLGQNNTVYQCLAPDIEQYHVIDHSRSADVAEVRNVLTESARIARGEVLPLAQAQSEDYDGLIIPGGFGVAKNLCNYAVAGTEMQVEPTVLNFCQQFKSAEKPIGLICIAPVMAPAVFGRGVVCTIGNDTVTAADIESMGGVHQQATVDQIVIDQKNKLVTTPAYMLADSPATAFTGIDKLVKAVIELS